MPLPISKFIRSRLNKTRLHREWKEGRKSIGTQKKGAPPPACISFDFAMPSIFIPAGEGRDRATIEHNVDGTREACRMAPFRLISIAAKREKIIAFSSVSATYRVERGQPRSNERNEIETASLDSRPVSHEKLERQSTHPPWLWVEAGNLSHRSRLYILRHFNVILFWHETIIPTIRTAIRIVVRKWRPW